jgi:hypothetical protein
MSYYPLCELPWYFFALEDVCQWPIEYDPNRMSQEAMLELCSRHENCVE